MFKVSSRTRLAGWLLVVASLVAAGGCNPSRKVSVPQLLTPLAEADTSRLISEINRLAVVRSLRGKVDIQFLDTSFAECGVAEKYRTAEGSVTLQRPGQVYLTIDGPFGVNIAQMTSDGRQFRVAVLRGDEKYKKFVKGTNDADYGKLPNAEPVKCNGNGDQADAMGVRTVSALSSLRPQHFTDALLLLPAATPGANFTYAQTETFEEEPDARPRAKKGARVVRGYYLLVELVPLAEGRARVTRRFWFDRVGELRLARVQTYDARGQLTTDVVYKSPVNFGEAGTYKLPSQIELTRPQDRYALRISYQTPESVKLDQPYEGEVFDLKNSWNLPEVDLDAGNRK
jgi:hypothetical protein